MKIWQWLRQRDPYGIYLSDELKADYLKEVGTKAPDWNECTYQEVKAEMEEEGLGGELGKMTNKKLVSGNDLASCLAGEHGFSGSIYMGRGKMFRDAISYLIDKDV